MSGSYVKCHRSHGNTARWPTGAGPVQGLDMSGVCDAVGCNGKPTASQDSQGQVLHTGRQQRGRALEDCSDNNQALSARLLPPHMDLQPKLEHGASRTERGKSCQCAIVQNLYLSNFLIMV